MKRAVMLAFYSLFLGSNLLCGGERVALVIGNDEYQHASKLSAAVNDATAVSLALQGLNFKVIRAMNAGVETMLEAVNKLKQTANGAESVLVYYAGHGIESGGVNYLVPVDARLEREVQLKTQTISLDDILGQLQDISVPARMVILDCCRDNPLQGRSWLATRGGGRGLGALAQESLSEATLVVYSASPGKPALDRVGEGDAHSPFTAALLEQLPRPGVHSFEMFGLVEDGVIERTDGRQAPRIFYNGSTQPFRNFRFSTGGGAVMPVSMPASPLPAPVQLPAVSAPVLPASGYFDLQELYDGGPYAGYNERSQTSILQRVQQKLKATGHYTSTVDGSPGRGTQQAILAWQNENGIKAAGKLDSGTLQSLGLQGIPPLQPAPAAPPASPAARGRSDSPASKRRQKALDLIR